MYFFIEAFLLGLLFNAAPGVVFTETIKRGVNGGTLSALYVQIGSLIGDALWAILGLIGIGILLSLDSIKIYLSIASSLYLFYLSYDSFKSSIKENNDDIKESLYNSPLVSGVILSITNPQNLVYWAALGSAFSALGIKNPETHHYIIFLSGFMISSLFWCFFCAFTVGKIFQNTNSLWKNIIYKACAITFSYLAVGILINI